MNLNSIESNIIEKPNFRDLIIFLVPILIFGLYLFAYKPGILTAASFSQLHQIASGDFTNAYPILHTFIEIICLRIRSSPSTIGILQIFVFCAMWTVICKYHRDDTAQSSNEFVLQFILTLIICLIPINAVYSITLSANILFSYALMFLCFLIKVLVDKNGQIDNKLTILLALTLVAISGLNTFGVLIAIILLILIARYLLKKGTPQNTLIKFAGITIVCILLVTSLNFIYDANQDNTNFKMNDAFDDGVDLAGARSEFLSSANVNPVKGYENVTSTNLGNGKFELVDSFANMFRNNLILGGLFDNPIMNLIYSIVLLGFLYFITQEREMLYVYMPIAVSVIIALITGRNNYYYVLLAFYLLAIIFISLYVKLDLKPQDIASVALSAGDKVKSPKQEEIEYVEPQQPTYEDDYSYIEAELEDLTLDDINEMLGETPIEEETPEPVDYTSEGDTDLLDEILKEIEMEKK